MTTETLDAIFEHGSFRLVQPPAIPLREGQRVRLIVETEESPDAILALAASVYAGLSPQDITEVVHAKNATAQLAAFDRLCSVSIILPLTDAIVIRAATIYANLHQRGVLIGDADILIAATGLEHGLIVVTNNESHYQRISGIQLENWLA